MLMRTQTSGNPTGVIKPMISLLIDVNETVAYKVKNYWTVNLLCSFEALRTSKVCLGVHNVYGVSLRIDI